MVSVDAFVTPSAGGSEVVYVGEQPSNYLDGTQGPQHHRSGEHSIHTHCDLQLGTSSQSRQI